MDELSEIIVKETIVDLIKSALENNGFEENLELPINPEVIDVMNKIMVAAPNFLGDIQDALTAIVLDGKINSKDIPQLIILVKSLYKHIYSLKGVKMNSEKRSEISAGVIKFIFHLLVKENKIKIDADYQVAFLDQFDELVDSCVSLLGFSKMINPTGCWKKMCKCIC
jgi:hypothetical protein